MQIISSCLIIIIIYTFIIIMYKKIYNLKKYRKTINNVYINKLNSIILDSKLNIRVKNLSAVSIIIILSILFFIIAFIIAFSYFDVFSTSFILSLISSFIPYFILKYKIYSYKQKIINIFPNYAMSLKNYTDVNNDIVEAFKRADTQEPLKSYINKFNISIQKGIRIFDAFETLKADIGIKRINEFITLLQFCQINGGNFTVLLDKFCKIQMKINIQKEKEKQEIFSSKLVLVILIIINIYVLFGFILQSSEYFDILTNTFIGKLILNLNVLSYILIIYIYTKLNKMEE